MRRGVRLVGQYLQGGCAYLGLYFSRKSCILIGNELDVPPSTIRLLQPPFFATDLKHHHK
jgi:hypothetical protein